MAVTYGTTSIEAPGEHERDDLFPVIYGELRRVAGRYLGRERINHTLQPTALVNEAWLRMQKERGLASQGRTQGLALAAQAMRRLLVDHGRHQKRQKRGGRIPHVELDELLQAAKTSAVPVEELLALEDALTRFEAILDGEDRRHVEASRRRERVARREEGVRLLIRRDVRRRGQRPDVEKLLRVGGQARLVVEDVQQTRFERYARAARQR
jgi:RNA polymerase sigma factor (TIGR02999 family)